jgi:DNA primase/predicted transcriptional regulator
MEIAEIKSRLTLATVLQHYGLQPDKNSRLNCPFHDDKNPSMQVYPKTNTVYCFSGNCKTHGKSLDVIDFIMNKENCTKAEAIEKSVEMVQGIKYKVQGNLKSEYRDLPLDNLEEVFFKMKYNLKQSKTAKAYCEERNLNPEALEIGYNGRTYKNLLHCLVFPLKNKAGKITSLYGRSSVNNTDSKHFYLKDSNGLYPNYPSRETTKQIITESIIDAASLQQIKSINENYSILASYGTNRLNEEIKTAIKELPNLTEIIFAFDNDEAGGTATAKYTNELKAILPQVKFTKLNLPNKDVNETLQAHNEEIFEHLLKNRTEIIAEQITESSFSNEPVEKEKTIACGGTPLESLQTKNPHKLIYATQTATYYVKGGVDKQMNKLTVTLEIRKLTSDEMNATPARSKLDLYEDKQVEKLANEVAEKLQLNFNNLIKDLHELTDLLDNYRESQLEMKENIDHEPPAYLLTPQERTKLETFLKQPNVIKRLNELLGKTGIVGEERNRIFLLLIAISFKMKDTLHSLIQGSSGSGKTKIVRQVSDCMPTESVTRFTRISDKALYNYPETYFKNRLLIVEDVDGLSEDAEMAFRELQSSGELRSSVSIKLENGQITGGAKIVKGPIASMSCTTKGEIYEDNMSRVFLIAVDESAEQTKRIIQYQNQKASGKIDSKEEKKATAFLQNLIRIIDYKEVINPYAEKIKLPEEAHKIRRLNDLFHNFIKMVTLTNQYQRKLTANKQLITEIEDIEIAVEIMFESIVLKVDELDGSLRQFYENLKAYLKKTHKSNNHESDSHFTQREIRQALQLSKAQINRYLQSLVELEYVSFTGFANKGFKYKVMYWDNYEAMRKRIKDNLTSQIESLK